MTTSLFRNLSLVVATLLIFGFVLWPTISRSLAERQLRGNLKGIREVHVRGHVATTAGADEDLIRLASVLSHFPHVTTLDITGGGNITDTAFPHVAKLTQLDTLYVADTEITDSAIMALCRLRRLRTLALKGCIKITDKGILELACLPELRSLHLEGTSVTSSGVHALINRNAALKNGISGVPE